MTDSTNQPSVTFSADTLADAVPFGFIIDRHDHVVSMGRALRGRVSQPLPSPVSELFELISPRRGLSLVEALRGRKRSLKLRMLGTEISLRGEPVPLLHREAMAFLGAPIVTTVEQMSSCGLQLRDFSAADATPDLLLSMQVKRTALRDANLLSEQLRASVLEAEEAVRIKGRFLAVMSHEIRTPMNGLGSMVDLLLQTDLSPEQMGLIQTIDDCSLSLQVLLNDILDLSKLEAERLETESVPTPIGDIAHRVVRMFGVASADRGVTLTVDVDSAVPAWIIGDGHRIRQILSNLVSNAIKFTSEGSVHLSVRVEDPETVTIAVKDTGLGVAEDAQAKIFEAFTQADASTTRQHGGTGLGLSIARGLAQAMGGELELSDTGPQGSTFELQIPGVAVEAPKVEAEPILPPAIPREATGEWTCGANQMSVLVVDDNPVNLTIAGLLLKKLGVNAVTKSSGEAAIDAVRSAPVDLILMDLMMPRMGGMEATKLIRQLPVEWANVPVVAFSADVRAEVKSEAEAAGMQGFLEKPVRLHAMKALLESVGWSARDAA